MRRIYFGCAIAFFLCSSFYLIQKTRLKLPKEFVKVPSGSVMMHRDSTTSSLITEAFYMSAYEVSNLQYRNFLQEVSSTITIEEKEKLLPDTSAFNIIKAKTEALKKFYFSHSMSDHYPVVNISHYSALKYCQWLQLKLSKENPGIEMTVRLPTKAEWIWAAQGGRKEAMFPWSNYYLHNSKGEPMCNFKSVNDRYIYRNRQTGKAEIAETGLNNNTLRFTSIVNGYTKNNYGIYNILGNVSEMIAENGTSMGGSWNDYGGDIHIKAESKYDSPQPTVGFRPVIQIKEKK